MNQIPNTKPLQNQRSKTQCPSTLCFEDVKQIALFHTATRGIKGPHHRSLVRYSDLHLGKSI